MVYYMLAAVAAIVAAVVIYDITQRKKAILHNFPIVGHFRYWLEAIGPELRQYIVTSNDEELPFNRDQRRWVYASSKKENNYFGFGTDNDLENAPNQLIIKQTTFPLTPPVPGDYNYDSQFRIPCAKVLGGQRDRKHKFRPESIVNISGMSFGSLSGRAVEAMNKGAKIAGCWHNTGEGGITPYHDHGADLVWQIGTGYFGCRTPDGTFDLDRLKENVEKFNVRALEIKLSQGAKPGAGGLLPARKVTPEIAKIRGIPEGKDCLSPASHSVFSDADSMLDFVEMLAAETGLPVGIKSAVGKVNFFEQLAELMERGDRGVDFITIDGGEGGTGAGPLVFTDHVAFPLKIAFTKVYKIFAKRNLSEKLVFGASGKLGWPESAIISFALGADYINVGRSAMLAIGCIQAQRCHTNRCPTGVTTHKEWLVRGLDPDLKSVRLANYILTLRKELLHLSYACGFQHPAFISAKTLEFIDDRYGSRSLQEIFGYEKGWSLPAHEDLAKILNLVVQVPKDSEFDRTG